MNQIFRIVFNRALGVFQVASETARSHGKTSGGDKRNSCLKNPLRANGLAAAIALALGGLAAPALAIPSGGLVLNTDTSNSAAIIGGTGGAGLWGAAGPTGLGGLGGPGGVGGAGQTGGSGGSGVVINGASLTNTGTVTGGTGGSGGVGGRGGAGGYGMPGFYTGTAGTAGSTVRVVTVPWALWVVLVVPLSAAPTSLW